MTGAGRGGETGEAGVSALDAGSARGHSLPIPPSEASSRALCPAGGPQSLRIFRRAIRDGATVEEACEATGRILVDGESICLISAEEARIILASDAKYPPPPEAYELIGQPQKETEMMAAQKNEDDIGKAVSGEYKRPDAKKAFDIYDKQIAPKNEHMATIRGELSQPYADIKEHANFPRPVLNFINQLRDMEDAKRDHYLLALSGGLAHCKITMPRDLVTIAEGKDGAEIVPIGNARKGQLATLPGSQLEMGVQSDGTETGLADAGEGFTEASPEELAAQKDRPESKEPAYGTGAAAMKAMDAKAKGETTETSSPEESVKRVAAKRRARAKAAE